jgi:RNA polymerase sigma-70 factor (ECF subfamily)
VDKKEQFINAIKQYEGFVYKIASAYTNTSDDRNDLVQEILYQLWKSFDSFQQKSSIGTWIYRVALNVAIYQLKQSKRRIQTISVDEHFLYQHQNEHSDDEEKWQLFRVQMDKLNLLDKGIVLLYLDNKSYDEIAAIIGISKTNVGTKLQRIKEKLKKQINKN